VKYVELHHHTTYSYMDGHGTPAQHAEAVAVHGMSAMAITDHGNTSGHVQTEKACLKFGIKPIFGLEAYTAIHNRDTRKMHLTILAMDLNGYHNLNRIVRQSFIDFYQWPTVYGETIARYSEGLIVLSGCSDSLLACSLLGGKQIPEGESSYKRAKKTAAAFRDLLGDRYYLECQIFPELERSQHINAAWEQMGAELGIPLVATGDVHTVQPGDHELRALLHAAGRGNNTIAKQLSSWEYEVPDYVPRSDREVFERAQRAGLTIAAAKRACAMTAEIADRCNVTLPKAERFVYPATEAEASWSR
jgi:DNA polymerase-3 subunit alpha